MGCIGMSVFGIPSPPPLFSLLFSLKDRHQWSAAVIEKG